MLFAMHINRLENWLIVFGLGGMNPSHSLNLLLFIETIRSVVSKVQLVVGVFCGNG